MDKTMLKGWLAALFSVIFLWGLNNILISYSAKVLEVNYLIYTCCSFISASAMLLLIGGLKDNLAKETLRSPDTILFGLIMLFNYLLVLSLFFYTSATEGTFLQRISMVFSLFVAWFFMQRKPNIFNLLGAVLVLIGITLICSEIPKENRGIIYLIMFLEGMALTARTFAAETHKTYNRAVRESEDPKLKTRVVGFVMFLVSIFFLIFSFCFAILQTYFPVFENSTIVPVISDFYDYKTIFAGLVAGIIFMTPLRIIEFFSTNTIKSENFIAITAFAPFATLFWQWLLEPITGLGVKSFSSNDWLAGSIITFGCLLTAFYQMYRTKKYGVEKWRDYVKEFDAEDMHVYHSKDIVKKTLNHYDNNILNSAVALGVSNCTIEKISKEQDFGFKDGINSIIMANFKENIANIDYLTKIANRSGFKAIGEEFIDSTDLFTLMFIDLDKFKPINDTYGHDAGDEVLVEIAKRLENLETEDVKVARLAGDEFVILFRNYEKSHLINHLAGFEEIIKENIKLSTGELVNVGSSIGLAEFDTDAKTLDDMLEYADKRMYSHKESK